MTLRTVSSKPPNEEVISFLEELLGRAKVGKVRAVYMAAIDDEGSPIFGSGGDACPFVGIAAVSLLQRSLESTYDIEEA